MFPAPASSWIETGVSNTHIDVVPRMSGDITKLPAKGVWHCYVHKLRAWVTGEDGFPVRPYLMLVVSTEDGRFLSCDPGDTAETALGGNMSKTQPSSEMVLRFLKRVMSHPTQINGAAEKLAPTRPRSVKFADTNTAGLLLGEPEKWAGVTACAYVDGCRAALAALGINEVSFAPVPKMFLENVIRGSIEPGMAPENVVYGTQHLPGLLESTVGFTPAFGKSLFAAAAAYARAAPWETLAARRPVQFVYRLVLREDVAVKLTAFGSAVGSKDGGLYGFSVHKTLETAMLAYDLEHNGKDEDEQTAMAAGGQTCMFTSVYETPFEDVDNKELFGWEIAASAGGDGGDADAAPDEENWPLFCKVQFEKGENGAQDTLALTRPAIIELQCFELMFKGVVELLHSGELQTRSGENARDAKGPWTVKCASSAGSEAGETSLVELEISLPALISDQAGTFL